MFEGSRIYVAGHTGLLGTALVRKLREYGYVNILARPHEELDLTNQVAVDEFFKTELPEYVFLAAGLTGGISANKTYPARFLHTNIAMQDSVFEAAHKYNVKHLIFYGSSCVYPKNCAQPMNEDQLLTGKMEETSEAYAIAKASGLIACRAYNNQFANNRFMALLPNSMYGPNDNFDSENSHVLSALMGKLHTAKAKKAEEIVLWGSGNPRREFIFSRDAAEASIFAMQNPDKLQNMHYNIGTGVDYSIRELAEIISQIVGYRGRIEWDTSKPDGTPRKLLDSSRFLDMGWKPATTLENGLKITYKWFLEKSQG